MQLERSRVVLIGVGGIGREIAVQLAARGASIMLADIDINTAQSTAQAVKAAGGTALAVACDMASSDALDDLAALAKQQFGTVDLLINHAGVSVGGFWEAIPDSAWRDLMAVNVCGVAGSIARMLPLMAPGARIVNTSSGLGLFHDLPFAAPYIASKAALIAMSRVLADYVKGRGIGVTVFCPDITNTAFVTSGKLFGIAPEIAAGGIPWDTMQTAASAAADLIAGLEQDQFLVSLVDDTQKRLLLMAAASLAPGSDRLPRQSAAKGVITMAEIGLPAGEARSPAIKALADYAATVRSEPGCIEYAVMIPVENEELIYLREMWESDEAFKAHQVRDSSVAFLTAAGALGFTSFTNKQLAVVL
ncbi:SDR family NAD(P)-dependent oxidoreductase [Novosphingobium sp.]|uniref:SDR family NAD(P)-dependent oxidoreductase n=1 Tax=Novosphingobium sp. TaxID=1874826 RepID=UPI003BAC3DB1